MSAGDGFERVASVETVRESPQVVSAGGHAIGLFYHEGSVYATDNRCPHMGFPLTDGSIDDGILTCPWHHARFELSGGDTLDPFADDVWTYPVEVRDGEVYVDPDPERDASPADHWRDRLEHGLREDLSLVVAKAVIGLDDAGVPPTVALERGVAFGTHYRREGWGRGLTTLAAMGNLLDVVDSEDRRRALYVGLTEVADECAGEPPFFVQDPLSTQGVSTDRLAEWFRDAIEVRDSDGAERVLRTAVAADADESTLVGTLLTAATDHRYLDAGHRVDFLNKACELLDSVGWDRADDVLPSLVPSLAAADRAEEDAAWRQPIDVAALCADAAADLPDLLDSGSGRTWTEPDDFVAVLLGDDPRESVAAVREAVADGATAGELADVVAYAAARRVAQFGTSNEFGDWNTVHHTYTYANAVSHLARRTDAPARYRAVLDGVANLYLDRFLNVPPAPLPEPDGDGDPAALLDGLAETFEVESDAEVDRAGRLTAAYLAAGGDPAALKRALAGALLREDAGFHPRQNVEAAFAQYDALAADEPARARLHLVATARYLAAHTPTRRAGEQTFRIAARLHRGKKIHEA